MSNCCYEELRGYVVFSRVFPKQLFEMTLRFHSPIPNALEKIASLRMRHSQLASSINRFEARISKQTGQLARMNRSKSFANGSDDDNDDDEQEDASVGNTHKVSEMSEEFQITAEDFKKEEEEIRELERKKRALEDRVTGMERDLGGLLR